MSKLYFPGDQLTPEISEAIALPEADPFLSIVTDGFTNIDDVSPIACQAANCTITLRRLIKYFRSLKEGEVVKKWASASSLCVIPPSRRTIKCLLFKRRHSLLFQQT